MNVRVWAYCRIITRDASSHPDERLTLMKFVHISYVSCAYLPIHLRGDIKRLSLKAPSSADPYVRHHSALLYNIPGMAHDLSVAEVRAKKIPTIHSHSGRARVRTLRSLLSQLQKRRARASAQAENAIFRRWNACRMLYIRWEREVSALLVRCGYTY